MRALKTILALVILVSGLQPIVAADLPPEELSRLRRDAENDPQHLLGAFLGVYYETGAGGVRQDYAEAAKWYRLCAETGYDSCQLHLGMLYSRGKGVPQDFSLAHMWFNLAAGQGGTLAVELRDRLAASMPPSQIAEAQKLAREWRPGGEAPFWRANPEAWVSWLELKREAVIAWPHWDQVKLPFYGLLCGMAMILGFLYAGELIIAAVAWRKTGKWEWKGPLE